MTIDLFDLEKDVSLIRTLLKLKDPIDLKALDIPTLFVPNGYERFNVFLSPDPKEARQQLRDRLSPILEDVQRFGYGQDIYTFLYEATLNAHEHGNRLDPKIPARIAYSADWREANFIVMDEGGILKPEFVPFILRQREGDKPQQFLDFYSFSGLQRPSRENLGQGTSFMHSYADEVKYFKSGETKGLAVRLIKKSKF